MTPLCNEHLNLAKDVTKAITKMEGIERSQENIETKIDRLIVKMDDHQQEHAVERRRIDDLFNRQANGVRKDLDDLEETTGEFKIEKTMYENLEKQVQELKASQKTTEGKVQRILVYITAAGIAASILLQLFGGFGGVKKEVVDQQAKQLESIQKTTKGLKEALANIAIEEEMNK